MPKKIIYVESRITIGGELPKQDINYFVTKLIDYLYEDRYHKRMQKEISDQLLCIEKNSRPFYLSLSTRDGLINNNFEILCRVLKLTYKIRTDPHVDKKGNRWCEMTNLFTPDKGSVIIPTAGDSDPIIKIDKVFNEINYIFNLYEKPDTDAPRHINDPDLIGEISRRKLAGEDLRKILTECLASRICYPDQTIPPLKII